MSLLQRLLSALSLDPQKPDDDLVAEAIQIMAEARNLARCHDDFERVLRQRNDSFGKLVEDAGVTESAAVIVVSGGWDQDTIEGFVMWCSARGWLPLIVQLDDGESIDALDEDEMREAGWCRCTPP